MSRTVTAKVVCSPAEVLEMKTAASAAGMSLSAWMRQVCLDAARCQSQPRTTQNITVTQDTLSATNSQPLSQLHVQVSQLSQTVSYMQQQLAKLETKDSQVQPNQVTKETTDTPQAIAILNEL